MTKYIVILCQLLAINLSAQNWDSLYQLNRKTFDLIDTDLDNAEILNQAFFNNYLENSPDSLKLSYWETDSKINFYLGNYDASMESNLIFLDYAEQLKDTFKIFEGYIGLGVINYYTQANRIAFLNLKKSIHLVESSSIDEKFIASPCNTIGAIYNSIDKPDSAIFYYQKAIEAIGNDTAYTSDYLRAVINANLGALYLRKNKTTKAKEYLLEGVRYNKKINRNTGLVFCSNKLGEIYLVEKNFEEALSMFSQADSIAVFSSTFEMQKDNKFSLIKYYLAKSNDQEALQKLEEFNAVIDSVIEDKTNRNIQDAQAEYEVEKTHAALELEAEKANRLNAENKNKEFLIWIIAGVLIAILMVFFFVYKSFQNRRKIIKMELTIKENQLDEVMANQESKTYSAMLRGQEEERERIAQDLHDRLGGTLAALKLSLRKPGNSVDKEDLVIVDEAVNEVRSIAHNLSSGILQKYGLNEALLQLQHTVERAGGVKFSVYLHPSVSTLGQSVTLELYRIVQELVSNTLKHAEASIISIQTNFDDHTFNLIFEDDGKGFNPN